MTSEGQIKCKDGAEITVYRDEKEIQLTADEGWDGPANNAAVIYLTRDQAAELVKALTDWPEEAPE